MDNPSSVRVFISYSHKDKRHLESLQSHLSALTRTSAVSVRNDVAIGPGENWRSRIAEFIDEAHLILLLVSADFLESDFIMTEELKRARARQAEGKAQIVSLILRNCRWQRFPEIADYQVLPPSGSPITKPGKKDDRLTEITENLERIVESLAQGATSSRIADDSPELMIRIRLKDRDDAMLQELQDEIERLARQKSAWIWSQKVFARTN